MVSMNEKRLIDRINALGKTGIDAEGKRTRLAADDAEKAGRDLVAGWMREAGLEVTVDYIGNIIGLWETEENKGLKPVMTGSHIDTVINAGQYDGCYGVIAGLEVIQSLKEAGVKTKRPMAVCAFTNEEGVRYSPDMMGSLVYAGGMSAGEACATVGIDGTVLGEELKRIGYAGTVEPGTLQPHAFVELHIEQGPILEAEGYAIGAVENLQGISWQQITIEGVQNHAGTTPTAYRQDAGLAAADENIVKLVEKHAGKRGMSCRRITSGAGQDAQNMALLCPTAMIFSPSVNGISHNPKEYTSDEDLLACARVFMDVMTDLAEE